MGNKSSSPSPKTMKELRDVISHEYTNEEIESWYDDFKASLSKGESALPMEAFIKVYSKTFVGETTRFAEQVFRVFDTNGNGRVDFKEFMLGMYVSGSPLDEEQKLDWAFRMYDRNGDGYITKEEMLYMFDAICRMTLTDLPATHSTPEMLTDHFFEHFDENNDEKISKEEFISKARTYKEIIDMLEVDPFPED
ncbi:hippocalcin-like protein 1 [Pecten maximus]|uniref:hippocalcin-like protein 1 n=1 Tax=Pecten maximus TaxID=6579 RepID=UPI00145858A4|nr:hippocalcin-like protein 1 [Pecten maximus]XP_033736813.1 hippocalcin-like protein 1 [Pecten maximus]XP_033736814.1 hippocalcin-like protein 1 [Pecten maximus]